MSNQRVLTKLRNILAGLYLEEDDQRRVAIDAGLNVGVIDFHGGALNIWNKIIQEAEKHEKVDELIAIACNEYPSHPDLPRFIQEFRVVVIPFVIAAMTKDEASVLFDKTVFNDTRIALAKQALFQNFQNELVHQGLENLQACYNEAREEWRPAYCTNGCIQQIICDTFTSLNKEHLRPENQALFTPEFISASFFSKNNEMREEAIELLEMQGGVVVIDAISMFHPWLSQCINNASIGVHKHIAILVVSPVDATILPLNQYIEQAFIENMERAYKRFDTKYDHLCEIDLGNLRSLRRWFFRAIPETARLKMHRDVPLYANVDSMRQIQANKPQFGIDPIALSMGGI